MKPWQIFWRLITFRPWLYTPNLLAIISAFIVGIMPGLIAREFFNRLATAQPTTDLGLGWLLALLGVSSAGRIACMVGCQLTNVPFMLTSAALLSMKGTLVNWQPNMQAMRPTLDRPSRTSSQVSPRSVVGCAAASRLKNSRAISPGTMPTINMKMIDSRLGR